MFSKVNRKVTDSEFSA